MSAFLIGPIATLVETVVGRIWPDKTKVEEVKAQVTLALMKGEYDNELASITHVNQTMQAEAKSEHWAQWLWRPVIGFTFAGTILNNYVLMPYFAKWISPIVIPGEVWNAMLVVLGAAAATRGWQKIQAEKNK